MEQKNTQAASTMMANIKYVVRSRAIGNSDSSDSAIHDGYVCSYDNIPLFVTTASAELVVRLLFLPPRGRQEKSGICYLLFLVEFS